MILFVTVLLIAATSTLPAAPLTLRITGGDFRWHILYPGPDGLLDTPDDVMAQRHLHLPARRAIAIDLRSDDYVYSLHLPDREVTELAVPGKPYLLQFETENPGHYRLLGSQMCGYTHPELLGDLVVHETNADGIASDCGDRVPCGLFGHRGDAPPSR